MAAIKRMLEYLLSKPSTQTELKDDKEIMSVKQVSKFLGLDVNIVYTKCSKGDIPYFKLGRSYRFKKTDIEKWFQGQKEAPEICIDDYVNQYLQKNVLKT